MQTRARQAASLPASRKGTRKRSSAESTLPTRLAKKARLTAEPPPYLNTLPSPPDVPDDLQLYIWGTGDCGQFGLGVDDAEEEITRPRLRPWTEGEAKLESVVAGGMHSLFVDQTGLVWSCGTNDNAALGRITENVEDPTRLGQFVDEDELGFRPRPVQMPEDESFRAIQAVTGDSICATVDNRGELRAWGTFHALDGATNFSSTTEKQKWPVRVELPGLNQRGIEKVSLLANGVNHVLALTTHGHVYSWGVGERGQLGRRILGRRHAHGTAPERVALGSRLRKAVLIGSGSSHSFAVDTSGDVWAWGENTMGQTGIEPSAQSATGFIEQPVRVLALSGEELSGDRVTDIAGGDHHTLFLTAQGRLYSCGRCDAGQLGIQLSQDAVAAGFIAEPTLVAVPGQEEDPVVRIAVGSRSNFAITQSGALFSWGEGTSGELGIRTEQAVTPTRVIYRRDEPWKVRKVSCGGQHALALATTT